MNRLQRYFDQPSKTQFAYDSPLFSGHTSFPSFGMGLENLLNQFFQPVPRRESVSQTEKGIQLSLEMPGYSVDNLDVIADRKVLNIKAEKEGRYAKRSYSLPDNANIDEITAEFKDGVLTVSIPLERGEIRKIPIN